MPARDVEFHVLSFEGTPVSNLIAELSRQRFDTHLWCVGDPSPLAPSTGHVHLHRWEGDDFSRSLPLAVAAEITNAVADDCDVVVLAEQWHMADAVVHLDQLLRQQGLRDRVSILWNAQ
jgi:hypothetical protein